MIKIDVLADINNAVKDIATFQKKATSNLDVLKKNATSSFRKIGEATVFLNQGLELAGKAFRTLSNTVSAGINAAIIQEEAINDLNTALKTAGSYTIEASKDFQNYASELQKTSTVGDEAILKTAALGVQMAQLSGEQLKDATKAAVNFSAALGIDLDSAMRMIAKSALDSGSGLKRYGVEVKKGATSSETLANAIAKVNEQFAGAATSKINTYQGAITQASNSWGDLQEIVGGWVTQNPLVTKSINIINDSIITLQEELLKVDSSAFNDLIAGGIIKVIEGFKFMLDSINPVINAFSFLKAAGKTAFYSISAGISTITSAFIGLTTTVVEGYIELFKLLPQKFIPESWTKSVDNFQEKLTKFRKATFETTTGLAKDTSDSFNSIGESFENSISKERLNAIKKILTNTQQAVNKAAKASFEAGKNNANTFAREIASIDKSTSEKIVKSAQNVTIKIEEEQKKRLALYKKFAVDVAKSVSGSIASMSDIDKQLQDNLKNNKVDLTDGMDKLDAELEAKLSVLTDSKEIEKAVAENEAQKAKLQIENEKKRQDLINKAELDRQKNIEKASLDIIKSGASAAANAFLPGSGEFVGPLLDVLNAGEEATRKFLSGVIDQIPIIIERLIAALPIVIEVFADKMPEIIEKLADKSDEIILALVKSMPKVSIAIVQGMAKSLVVIPKMIAELLWSGIKGIGKFLYDAGKLFFDSIVNAIKNFSIGIYNAAVSFANIIIDALNGVFNFGGNLISDVGNFLGFSKGGSVKSVIGGTPNKDSVPALLMRGEVVVDRSTTDKLKNFLDDNDNNLTNAILAKILTLLSKEQTVSTEVRLNEKVFADIILNLSRTNQRLTV